MLGSQVPFVHIGAKWLLEVHNIGGAAAFRANLLLTAEVNAEKAGC